MYDCRNCDDRCPELLPENRAVWRLWTLVNTQWRMSVMGPVGLDYSAVFQVAEVLGIEVTPGMAQKMKLLEGREIFNYRK